MSAYYILALTALLFLAYRRERLWVLTAALIAVGLLATWKLGPTRSVILAYWLPLLPVALLLNARPLRRRLLSAPLRRHLARRLPLPARFQGEELEAGTVWWEAELLSGKPDWRRLLAIVPAALRPEESAYIENTVVPLCDELATDLAGDQPLAEGDWQRLLQARLFGLAVPRAHGGLEFSVQGIAATIQTLAQRSPSAAMCVATANALGPAGLISLYGTREQKDQWLPLLARGERVAALALTHPLAGIDPEAIEDRGEVCRIDDGGTLGFRIDARKRDVFLGPRADLFALVFRARDPRGLLQHGQADLGLTCVLVEGNGGTFTLDQVIADQFRTSGNFGTLNALKNEDFIFGLDSAGLVE